jgi:signal transduction histidine kinase
MKRSGVSRYNILIGATIIVGLISTIITIFISEANVRNFQIQKIHSLALIIDPQRIGTLPGTAEDVNNPIYESYKNRFIRVREANSEIRFLYLMRLQKEKLVFLLDSEGTDSPDYSAPGDTYEEASELFRSAFISAKTGFELDRDRWGFWLSSFAPIIDYNTGTLVAVLGADIDAYSQYFFPIIKAAMLPVIAFSFLFIILWMNRKHMLYQTESIEEKGSILRVISHEVRTPLTEIRWACEAVVEEEVFKQNLVIKNAITQILTSSVQMIQRLKNLENADKLTGTNKLDRKQTGIAELIHKSLEPFEKVARVAEVELRLDLTQIEDSSQVSADLEMLRLALQNVFFNLIYYADAKTTVTVSGRIDKDKSQVVITASGIGKPLPPDELDQVFAGYHRGDRFSEHTEGTGIGLFLAKKIIKLHGGDISVSVDEKDTAFTVKLPLKG